MIRDITSDDLPAVLSLNNAHAIEVNALTADALAALVSVAAHARVVDDGHGFPIALNERTPVQGPNHAWFVARYPAYRVRDRPPAMTSSLVQLIAKGESATSSARVARRRWENQAAGEVTPQVALQVTPQVEALLRLLAARDALSNAEIRAELKLKDRVHVQHSYIAPALDRGLVEMTIPNKPQSRLQRYQLTERGRAVLAKEESPR